ncbi:hypothetical protein ACFY2R_24530 [Micromonospora olivasterospora]|uniref:Uncharacterized protein n=1 Tax=Micromonospora olivasterospora TaxID=1880 RepID=A0A562I7R8_MICOL|nr:hypothetical protein [Micromonospora olivasterospora]TWH66942.1 hypothetical protein JD77_01903 [Micromonospora olivasterospora]
MGMPDADGSGPTDGLPGLPPEWGRVVVPDDASALAEEAEQVRRELRRRAGRTRWRGRLGLAPRPDGRLPLGLPLLVVLVAVLATVAGLFAVTWPRPPRTPDRPTVEPYPTPTDLTGRPLPALELIDAENAAVSLRASLPAMIILVDACACPQRVAEAAALAPPGVTVVTVTGGRTVDPTTASVPPPVRALADPAGGLRAFLRLPPRPDTAPALLVDRGGAVLRVVPELRSAEDYRADLSRLAA